MLLSSSTRDRPSMPVRLSEGRAVLSLEKRNDPRSTPLPNQDGLVAPSHLQAKRLLTRPVLQRTVHREERDRLFSLVGTAPP